MILVFIFDAVLVAGVLYWVFGIDRSSEPQSTGTDLEEVRGAPINDSAPAGTDFAVAAADGSDDGFSAWDDSPVLDDDAWEDFDGDSEPARKVTTAASGEAPGEAIAAMFPNQQDLPRPNVERPEHGDYRPTSFADIGNWKYRRAWSSAGRDAPDSRIPANILQWKGRKIAILGYMQPLDLDESNRVRRFMLMRNQAACCYGAPITLADWIEISPPDEATYESMLHHPICVLGTLDVGEKFVDDFAVSIFRMTPDKVLPPGENP